MTTKQIKLAKRRGTPTVFAERIWAAYSRTEITEKKAEALIADYQRRWDEAGMPHLHRFPEESWDDDDIQFVRLIDEAVEAGAFTRPKLKIMCQSMDLDMVLLVELVERARTKWQRIKERTKR